MTDEKKIRKLTCIRLDDVEDEFKKSLERQKTLHPKHPDHWSGAEISEGPVHVTLWWGGYEYWWPDEIKTPLHLLNLFAHVGQKKWRWMTAARIVRLIECVAHRKGWNVWDPDKGLTERDTKNVEERMKLTPALRWKVLQRDGFACRACGARPEKGAWLHIDHVIPISSGGMTEVGNLQTLCATCNFGKRDE